MARRTIESTRVRNKPKCVPEIVLDKIPTAAYSGNDDYAALLKIKKPGKTLSNRRVK